MKLTPIEVVIDGAAMYPGVFDELIPSAWHHVEQYANNPIEPDHSRLRGAEPGGVRLFRLRMTARSTAL
ncbi:DDE-type integrase/transposase/recombinase [Dactylosporangium sp. CA-233914]|uniref:DDE-type integrase/transposase/recombinase n=1 Tax=Dactylosporangium sp. CA-233914 TaxID=3239934 RepID=UPI003D8E7FA2